MLGLLRLLSVGIRRKGRAIGAAPDSGLAVPLGKMWLCVPAGWAGVEFTSSGGPWHPLTPMSPLWPPGTS